MAQKSRPGSNTQDASAAIADPILSWGSSVEMNEDLCKSIRIETQTIDAHLAELASNVKEEEHTDAQLEKDKGYTCSEMATFCKKAADIRDSAAINAEVRNRLAVSLREMGPAIVPSSSDPEDPPEDSIADEEKGSEDKAEARNGRSIAYAVYLQNGFAEIDEMVAALREEQAFLVEKGAFYGKIKDGIAAAVARMEADKLEDAVKGAEDEVVFRQEELAAEANRKHSTSQVIQQTRDKSEQHAKELTDLMNSKTAKKGEHAKHQAKLSDVVVQSKEDLHNMLETRSKHASELKLFFIEAKRFKEQLSEVEVSREEEAAKAKEHQAMEAEANELQNTLQELQAALEKALGDKKASVADQSKATIFAAQVQEERLANDSVEAEQVSPGLIEKGELVKEKEELARIMSELHEETATNDQDKELAEVKAELALAEKELNSTVAELEKQETTLEEIERSMAKERLRTEEEVQSHENLSQNWKLARDTHLGTIESETQAANAKLDEALKALNADHEIDCWILKRQLEIARIGEGYLRSTAKTISKLATS